ncbi:class I SAM-dependent methyltransferase [Aquifex pyrophilus]
MSSRFSRAASTYEEWAVPQRETAKKLVEFIKPRGLILDLGCGTGFVSEHIKGTTVGLDISEEMVRVYVEKFGKGILGDAENLPFKDKSFDYVLSNFALHWTDWRRSIKEALRVARKGVGVSIPVEGSVSFSEFPFPREEEILKLFNPTDYLILEVDIPFTGFELVKFFHFTGTSLYKGKSKVKTKRELERLAKHSGREKFRVLLLKLLK